MRLIDIKTTQNVTITYELASLRDRILATLIDWITILGGSGIMAWIVAVVFGSLGDEDLITSMMIILVLPIPVFYVPVMEMLNNGQTLGKMALRTKVVKLDGRQLMFFDFLLRWCFRLVDIFFSWGAIAAILSTSTDHGQRLGGLVSNSTVVRLRPTLQVSLKDILKINTKDNYVPVYPEIRNFREEDLLLIKQSMDRFKKHRNPAHRAAINELSESLKAKLGAEVEPRDNIKFLKTLIKDYIVLTR